MNFAQDQKAGSRLTGFGIVILIHVLIVWALASGLATKVVEAVKGPIDVKVVEEKVKPPPEVTVTAPPPPMAAVAVQSTTPPPTNTVAPTNPTPAPVAAPAPRPAKITAAMVCTKMGKPDIPAVNWAGRAEYKATATVKAGRVTSVELAVIRGANDRKAERALRAAVVSALTDTYECPGDHVFEQEFVFNID